MLLRVDSKTKMTMVIESDRWECESDPSKQACRLVEKAYPDEPYHVW